VYATSYFSCTPTHLVRRDMNESLDGCLAGAAALNCGRLPNCQLAHDFYQEIILHVRIFAPWRTAAFVFNVNISTHMFVCGKLPSDALAHTKSEQHHLQLPFSSHPCILDSACSPHFSCVLLWTWHLEVAARP
jgi:hypothetical protein